MLTVAGLGNCCQFGISVFINSEPIMKLVPGALFIFQKDVSFPKMVHLEYEAVCAC